MGNLIGNWVANHQQFLIGLATGWAATHPRIIVRAGFKLAMKVPFLDAAVKANGPAIHAWVHEGADELEKAVDEEAGNPGKP